MIWRGDSGEKFYGAFCTIEISVLITKSFFIEKIEVSCFTLWVHVISLESMFYTLETESSGFITVTICSGNPLQ